MRAVCGGRGGGERAVGREDYPPLPPRVRTGMIASGGQADTILLGGCSPRWRDVAKLLAVEMEGAGVAAAGTRRSHRRHRTGFLSGAKASRYPHTSADEGASTGERDHWKQTAARTRPRFLHT